MIEKEKVKLKELTGFDIRREFIDTEYNFRDESPPFHEVKDYKPKFSYQYLSFDESEYCFNNPSITKSDYIDLLEIKKELSNQSVDDLYKSYHFHIISFNKPRKRVEGLFKEKFKDIKIKQDAIPEFYQFAGSKDETKIQRVIGFFGQLGEFHIVWFDFEHQICPMDNV